MKFALIGKEIMHSLSPQLFRAAGGGKLGYSYSLLEGNKLSLLMDQFINGEYDGANITSPYKEEVLAYCNTLDPAVQSIGASNLIVKRGGKLIAYNTDCSGVWQPLAQREILPTSALVVGAGGAAKAAIYILKKRGFKVTVTNRDNVKGANLALSFGALYLDSSINSLHAHAYPLTIYTPPSWYQPFDPLVSRSTLIFEANYKDPSFHSIKKENYISGLEWLLWQAVEGFEIFTNKKADIDAMKGLLNYS